MSLKIKISETIQGEIRCRELWTIEGDGQTLYSKIRDTKPTRKDRAVVVEVTPSELNELYSEADYWSGSYAEYVMPLHEWKAWRALKKQCESLMKLVTN